MSDLDRALADLATIRLQIARQTRFLGLGSGTLAATAVLALATGFVQAVLSGERSPDPLPYFATWIAVAVLCAALVGSEAWRRSRRLHRGLADEMVIQAVEGLLPVGGAGACLGLVFARFAPDQVWMLPGLWQILVGIGLFASLRVLPRPAALVGAWYVLAGLVVFTLASEQHLLSPCLMALPFAVGQAALAAVMHRCAGGADA